MASKKKKKTTPKGRGGKARPKKASSKKKTAPASKKARAKKKTGKKTGGRKGPKKSWVTINPGLASQSKILTGISRWPRRKPKTPRAPAAPRTYIVNPGLPTQTRHLLPSGNQEHALVKAYEKAGGTPPGYVRSGTPVGAPGGGFASKKGGKKAGKKGGKKGGKKSGKKAASKKPSMSKEEFLAKMAAGRAAAKKTGGKKKTGRKAKKKVAKKPAAMASAGQRAPKKRPAKKHVAKTSPSRAASAKKRAHAPSASKKRRSSRRKGWPKVGAHKRTFGIAKFKAMNSLGVPPNHPRARAKRAELRQAAGRTITAKDVFNMVEGTGMKAWVCSGMRRTGCGGGSKMLRGSHQIGVFAVPKALQR